MDWSIQLAHKPAIALIGVGRHGVTRRTEVFRLPALWCVHLYRYNATVVCNDQVLPIRPGYASVFPPDAVLEYRYETRSEHLFAHFTVAAGRPKARSVPAMQDLGVAFAALNAGFEQAVGWFPTEQLRAEVRLWDILWQLTAHSELATVAQPHPGVTEALRLIELQLGEVIYVTKLAKTVGLSQNHLTRLFNAATGQTITAYIRKRRVTRAAHLLRHSTLPIKAIAAEVGIPDLHLFNKCVHRALHTSPRHYRHRGT